MKKSFLLITLLIISVCALGCRNKQIANIQDEYIEITDDLGNTFSVKTSPKIASCYASFAECCLLADGNLCGVTKDAIEEHNLKIDDKTKIIGTVKDINLEELVMSQPDYILLSADLSAHLALKDSLDSMNMKYGYFKIDSFDDYKNLMKHLCLLSGKESNYQKNVTEIEKRINQIKEKIPEKSEEKILLMRVYSTGIKAKSIDNIAGTILNELGTINIADLHPSLLEELSVEYILSENPKYIFILTMGNIESAQQYLSENIKNNEVWKQLDAVKNNNFTILPKNLFHYKPNNRWDESYEFLARKIYPEIFK